MRNLTLLSALAVLLVVVGVTFTSGPYFFAAGVLMTLDALADELL